MATQVTAPGLPEIERARERLEGVARVTPVFPSETLSRLAGRPVRLKAENLQRTGSFKIRGAYVKLSSLEPEHREAGVVAASRASRHLEQAVADDPELRRLLAEVQARELDPLTAVREILEKVFRIHDGNGNGTRAS